MIQNSEHIYDIDELIILPADKLVFTREESGFMSLDYEEKHYTKVSLTRLIPYMEKEKFISITYQNEDKEWKEIGVIEDISAMPEEQYKVVSEFLEFRYYIPIITKINKITDNRMGYLFLDVETTAGAKKLAVNDWWHNFRLIQNNMLCVTDADGNKYYIPDVDNMDKMSLKKLQLFI